MSRALTDDERSTIYKKTHDEIYNDAYDKACDDIIDAIKEPGNLEKWYMRQEPDEPLVRWVDVVNLIHKVKENQHDG